MIHILFQVLVFHILFLTGYDLFLKKETFFGLNRIYLLLTAVLGYVLPFISIGFIQENIPQEYILGLPAVLIGDNPSETVLLGAPWFPNLLDFWLIGITVSALIFFWKLYKIAKLKSVGTVENFKNFKLVTLPNTNTAFSFFNTIFLGETISEESKHSIIAHEKIHIAQRHSLDLIFFEVFRIFFWFNPMIYLFQNRMATLHEFIADAKVTAENDKKQYYQNLLSDIFQTEKISFINTFFNQSLIKKRISMLQKSKSKKIAQLKFLLVLPLLCAMLIYSSCSNMEKEKDDLNIESVPIIEEKDIDVPFAVIEKVPIYPGCTGVDNEAMKKCMSMNISQFVNENFNVALGQELDLSGRQRIAVQFKIDKTGKIVDVRARAQKPELEAEAIRVVSKLPQMQPGEQKGEKVGVLYSLPIIFDVQ